jgi:hypothetical protein
METRNITIVSTANQNKYVVSTDATTLAELKAALRGQGIDYDGMTFYEGLSHTELLTDEAILPHDVPYKGTVTNELVFMLTNPNKRIRSGASVDARQALYDAIVERGLKDACVATFGKNYTQCKNSELMAILEDNEEATSEACSCEGAEKVEAALRLLVDILYEDDYLLEREANRVISVLDGEKGPKSSYSDEEIDDMFDFLG